MIYQMTPRKNAEKCLRCGTPMMRLYLRGESSSGKRSWYPTGWLCPNPMCRHVTIDELFDDEENAA